MTDKPTGVFVRLPLSEAEKMALTSGVKMGGDIEAGITAIGTPVTGGELEVVGTIHIGDNGKPFFTAPEIYSTGGDVVRQSDALAKLAEKDAENTKLRDLLERLRDVVSRGMTQSVPIPGQQYPIGSHHHPIWVEIAKALERSAQCLAPKGPEA